MFLEGWPAPLREAVEAPDGAVVVYQSENGHGAIPPGRLLYTPGPSSPPPIGGRRLPGLAAAERAENQRDYGRAVQLYAELLAEAAPGDRALLLHRLARASQNAGDYEEALRWFGELQEVGDARVGVLPAGLIAAHGISTVRARIGDADGLTAAALELYTGLIEGRWPIEEARYLFYAEQAHAWLGLGDGVDAVSPEAEALQQIEARKLAFSALVREFVEDKRSVVTSGESTGLVFWSEDPMVALVVPAAIVQEHIWEPAISVSGDPAISLTLRHDDGTLIVGPGAASRAVDATELIRTPETVVTRELSGRTFPLRVEAWPASASALRDDLAARQMMYVGMLTLVVALLAFGSYLTVRTVRHEVEVARLKSRFVSAVSHEFRSPLTGIRQLAEMLLRDRVPSEEKKHGYYRMIAQESSRLTRLVENVLDFSRIEEDRMEYAAEPVDARSWLERVVEEFRQEVDGQGVTVAAEIPAALPTLRGDREALTCAVHNLLDNAVKYSPGQDTVWLEAEVSNGALAVRVRDRGLGISEADRRHVFEKFFRAAGGASEEVKGVGLGLSLVQHIVTAHGGSVALDSALGEGSMFTIKLPVAPGADAPGGPAVRDPSESTRETGD